MRKSAKQKVDEAAKQLVEEVLSTSVLALLPYLDAKDMEGISYQRMEFDLPAEAIARAKQRFVDDVRIKLLRGTIEAKERPQ